MIINHYSLTCIHNKTITYNIRQYNTYAHTYVRTYSYVHRYIMIYIYIHVYVCMHACMYIYICSMSIDGVYQTLEQRYKGTYVHIYIHVIYFPDEDGGSTLAGTSEAQGDARRCLQHAGCGSIWDDHHRGRPVAIGWDWGKTFPKNIKHADINRYIHITTCSYIYNIIYVYIYWNVGNDRNILWSAGTLAEGNEHISWSQALLLSLLNLIRWI